MCAIFFFLYLSLVGALNKGWDFTDITMIETGTDWKNRVMCKM